MKQFGGGNGLTVWLSGNYVTVGVGYDSDDLSKKEVVKLIAWLAKALARMK